MTKDGTRKGAWAAGAVFAAFSVAVALGCLYGVDLWVLRTVQERPSGFLDSAFGVFSLLGGGGDHRGDAVGVARGALCAWPGVLAGWILAIFFVTGLLELAMKLYLPQVPIPEEAARVEDYAPLVVVPRPYPYPSGHVLRSVIVFGALYLLWKNWFSRAILLVVLVGIASSRVYLGVHWASDVVAGALLGTAALLWAVSRRRG